MIQGLFTAIILASAALLIPHGQLMRRLGRAEAAFAPLEEALRNRLDLIVERLEEAPEEAELKAFCETARDAETEALLKAYPRIEKALIGKAWEVFGDEGELARLKDAYEKEIAPYSAMIKKFPWKLYAGVLVNNRK